MNNKNIWILVIILTASILISGCFKQPEVDSDAIHNAILKVLKDQTAGWNAFDIERYMQGYWQSDSLRFASGDQVQRGWDQTLERYKRGYPDSKAMGHLTFSDLDITIISEDAALVFGRFTLEREKDRPTGLFTLLFRKTEDGWRIVHDHTSTAQ